MRDRDTLRTVHVARIQHSVWASGVALSLITGPLVPTTAQAAPASSALTAAAYTSGAVGDLHAFFKKKKRKKNRKRSSSRSRKGPDMIPRKAQAKRDEIRGEVQSAIEREEWQSVAERLESEARELGDPVLFLEAADARIEAATKERSIELAEDAITTARAALDISHFYADVESKKVDTDWYIIDPDNASTLIERSESTIGKAESLIAEIEAERAAAAAEDDEEAPEPVAENSKDKKGKPNPNVLIGTGATFTALGVVGAGLGVAGILISSNKQKEVSGLVQPDDAEAIAQLDTEGKRANAFGYAGLALAGAGLAIGIPLIVIGVKKRKEAGDVPANASVQVLPMAGRNESGVMLSGRF